MWGRGFFCERTPVQFSPKIGAKYEGHLRKLYHLRRPPCSLKHLSGWTASEKLYIGEYTSGNLTKNWSWGYCILTALNTSFALFSQMAIRRQLCDRFDSKVSCDLEDKPDVYSLLLQILLNV